MLKILHNEFINLMRQLSGMAAEHEASSLDAFIENGIKNLQLSEDEEIDIQVIATYILEALNRKINIDSHADVIEALQMLEINTQEQLTQTSAIWRQLLDNTINYLTSLRDTLYVMLLSEKDSARREKIMQMRALINNNDEPLKKKIYQLNELAQQIKLPENVLDNFKLLVSYIDKYFIELDFVAACMPNQNELEVVKYYKTLDELDKLAILLRDADLKTISAHSSFAPIDLINAFTNAPKFILDDLEPIIVAALWIAHKLLHENSGWFGPGIIEEYSYGSENFWGAFRTNAKLSASHMYFGRGLMKKFEPKILNLIDWRVNMTLEQFNTLRDLALAKENTLSDRDSNPTPTLSLRSDPTPSPKPF
jgi:hypothetical protein